MNQLQNKYIRDKLQDVEYMNDAELSEIPAGSLFAFDLEVYPNFFYAAFKHLDSGKVVAFERSAERDFSTEKLTWLLWRARLIGFNSRCYDMPILELARGGMSCDGLKDASNYIIESEERITPWMFELKYGIKIPDFNHIDLIEVAPLKGSLKLYAGRLHCKVMQDLPFDPHKVLTSEEMEIVRLYCGNDLSNTELLFRELIPELNLREEMSRQYGIDLRSKSDAQLAEAVMKKALFEKLGYWPKRPTQIPEELKFDCPSFVAFMGEDLKQVLQKVNSLTFHLDGKGAPIMPKELEALEIKIGGGLYKLGMGGLHSKEKKVAHKAENGIIIADNDVESFYPRTILNLGLFPSHLGKPFLDVFGEIVHKRLGAKGRAKDKLLSEEERSFSRTVSDSLKITINGIFGKLGDKYSIMYAPELMLKVTLVGQLVLLMLIELLENNGIEVISANTDGIILKYHESRHAKVRSLIGQWETYCNYKTEETRYKAIYSRDVNNYIAVKERGLEHARFLDDRLGMKTKGVFSERGSALNSVLSKNPEALICNDAVLQYVYDKTPIETTINECQDIRRFVSIKNVTGGGEKNGVYLGKTVRWYYAQNEAGGISYASNGKRVGKTEGGKPVMVLPTSVPDDLDRTVYIEMARKALYDLGRFKVAKTKSLF